jgi:DsbC/DsbD-like thiol-disulfide interchange protein
MNARRCWLLLCVGWWSCAHAGAERAAPNPPGLSPEQVVQYAIASAGRVAPGGHGALRATLRIAPGYHLMSNAPRNPLYIATRVQFDAAPGVAWDDPSYPAASDFRLSKETIATFAGEIEVRLPFTVASDEDTGTRELHGMLVYQACTGTSCLFPVKRQIAAQIEITR